MRLGNFRNHDGRFDWFFRWGRIKQSSVRLSLSPGGRRMQIVRLGSKLKNRIFYSPPYRLASPATVAFGVVAISS